MKQRERKRRSYAPDFTGHRNDHGIVLGEESVGRWRIHCKHCGKEHLQSSRAILNNSHSRSCEKFKPHNYSGLEKWDGIIRRVYGITLQEYDDMLYEQGSGCAICGTKNDVVEGRRLAIDHCHDSGKVRGILCAKCNKGLGLFCDSVENLESAIKYLKKHK